MIIKKKYQIYTFLFLIGLFLFSHKHVYASSALIPEEEKLALPVAVKPVPPEEFKPSVELETSLGSEKFTTLVPLLASVSTLSYMRKFLSAGSLARLACVSKAMPPISAFELPFKMRATTFIKGATRCPEVFKEIRKAKLILSDREKQEELAEIAFLIGNGQFPNLRLLDLEGNRIETVGARTLAAAIESGNLLNLRGLLLGGSNIRNEGVEALMKIIELGCLPNLKALHLDANNIGVVGAQAISRGIVLGHLPNLVSLHLNTNTIGVAGSRAIADAILSGNLSNLKSLKMHMNKEGMGLIGIQAIVEAIISGKLPNLYELLLDWNLVKAEGIHKISEAAKEGKLPNFSSVLYYEKDLRDDTKAAIDKMFEEPTSI